MTEMARHRKGDILSGTAQTLTDSWVDLGVEIYCDGYNTLGVFLDVDINSSANVRIRALGKHTTAHANEYQLPVMPVVSVDGTSDAVLQVSNDNYIELNNDADQKIFVEFPLSNAVPYVQLQVEAGTVGATAGQILSAYVVLGYK